MMHVRSRCIARMPGKGQLRHWTTKPPVARVAGVQPTHEQRSRRCDKLGAKCEGRGNGLSQVMSRGKRLINQAK